LTAAQLQRPKEANEAALKLAASNCISANEIDPLVCMPFDEPDRLLYDLTHR
jgi:hypothetical protein